MPVAPSGYLCHPFHLSFIPHNQSSWNVEANHQARMQDLQKPETWNLEQNTEKCHTRISENVKIRNSHNE